MWTRRPDTWKPRRSSILTTLLCITNCRLHIGGWAGRKMPVENSSGIGILRPLSVIASQFPGCSQQNNRRVTESLHVRLVDTCVESDSKRCFVYNPVATNFAPSFIIIKRTCSPSLSIDVTSLRSTMQFCDGEQHRLARQFEINSSMVDPVS